MKHREGCPVKATIRLLAGKWKVQIFWHLSFGQLRFAELRKKLPRISEKVLTDHLRQLERDGVITRQVSGSVPPAVSYSLNAEGEKLVPIVEALCDWGSAHFQLRRWYAPALVPDAELRRLGHVLAPNRSQW